MEVATLAFGIGTLVMGVLSAGIPLWIFFKGREHQREQRVVDFEKHLSRIDGKTEVLLAFAQATQKSELEKIRKKYRRRKQ